MAKGTVLVVYLPLEFALLVYWIRYMVQGFIHVSSPVLLGRVALFLFGLVSPLGHEHWLSSCSNSFSLCGLRKNILGKESLSRVGHLIGLASIGAGLSDNTECRHRREVAASYLSIQSKQSSQEPEWLMCLCECTTLYTYVEVRRQL